MTESLRHIIFDFDGTLIDSAPDLAAAVDAMLYDLKLPPAGLEQVKLWIGNGAAKLVERALNHKSSNCDQALFEQALSLFFQHYQKNLAKHSMLYPGVKDGLTRLHQSGFQLSLCTNKPAQFTLPLLEYFDFKDTFHSIVCGDSLTHKKPHPEPLLWLCQQTTHSPAQSLMVGDSMNDVKAANAANMLIACFDYGYAQGANLDKACNGLIYSSFNQLVDTILAGQLPNQVTSS